MPFELVCMKNIVEIKNMDLSQISYYLSTLFLTYLATNRSYTLIDSTTYKNVENTKTNHMC